MAFAIKRRGTDLSSYTWGWINEIKVGNNDLDNGQNPTQVPQDRELLSYGFGIDANKWDKNWILPVNYDIWWFFPNASRQMSVAPDLWAKLTAYGINIVMVFYDPYAPIFPKKQSKKEKEDEVKELDGDHKEALEAVDSIFTPSGGMPRDRGLWLKRAQLRL